MAISYVGGVAGGRAGATSTTTQSLSGTLTGGSGSSPLAGDLVCVWCSAAGDGTGAVPTQSVSGNNNGAYSTTTHQSITTATYDPGGCFNYKIQGGTVDTTITIPSSGNARNAQRWAIHVFRNVDSTTPLDVTATYATGSGTGRPNPAAITPVTAGAYILWCGASGAATGIAYTAPTGFTTNWRGGTTADTADCMNGFGYYTGWTSGSYDPAAITAGGTTNAVDAWVATTVALRPAPNAYTLTANSGSYSITGQSAELSHNRSLTASNGSYSLAGQAAIITYTPAATGYELIAQNGTYSITGQTIELNRGSVLNAASGSYDIAGQSATLLRTKLLVASSGSYSLSGQSATITFTPLTNNYTITAQAGSYVLSGQSADLLKSKLVVASSGSYSVSGQDANIVATVLNHYTLTAQVGTYATTGQSATIVRNRVLSASSGSYTLTGRSASYGISYIFPPTGVVLSGIIYGDTQQFTGTYDPFSVKLNISDGSLIKPISDTIAVTISD